MKKPPKRTLLGKEASNLLSKKDYGIRFPDPRFLSNGFCRAIIGNPRDMLCCGRSTLSGSVYCSEHHEIHTEKPRKGLEHLARILR